jgi:putative ABC transport system permease protein
MRPEHWLYTVPLRLRSLFRRPQVEQELDEEFQYHIEQKTEEYVARGFAPEDARLAAVREMDGADQRKEECRDMRHVNFIDDLTQDLRYAVRMLLRSPGFTLTAVMALALGIGATTAIFSVVNKVLLEPLPYPEPDRLVALNLHSPRGTSYGLAVPEFMAMRGQTETLQDATAYDFGGPGINLTGVDTPEQLKGIHVSANYFKLFGAPIELGRTFSAEEDLPHGPHVVVISDGLWHSHFAADPNMVGKTISLGGEPHVVIGVVGPGFKVDPPTDIWLPLQADPNSTSNAHYLLGAARLKRGATVAKANAGLKLTADKYRRTFTTTVIPPDASFGVTPLRDLQVSGVRASLFVLLGAVAFVLLIACANVANLLLARATLRKREIAIRAALGAGRGRMIRQLLTESVLLSLAGGALGLFIGYYGVHALLAINSANIPRIGEHGSAVTVDWRVLVFTLAVSVLTGILFGLIPAFSASRSDLNVTLKESSSRSGSGFRQNKARSILVVTEIALALVLLIGAALLIRTFLAMRTVDPGFDPHNVITMQMSLTGSRFDQTAGVAQMEREAEQRVGSIPGVESVAATCSLPLQGALGLPFYIEGRPTSNGNPNTGGAEWVNISPQLFKTFHIPLIRGREFTDLDDGAAPSVAIINESFAKQYWPKGNPIGERITIGKGMGPDFAEPPREVIGIVADVRDQGLNADPGPIMYTPTAQVKDGVTKLNNGFMPIFWAVRTKAAPSTLIASIQNEIRTASGGLPVAHIETMDEVVKDSTSRTNFDMTLLSIFAGVALLLAAIGIYGLMAYSVQQRTQEIGIRMALGASAANVLGMVVRQGMTLAMIGIVLGLGAALGLARLIASLLFGVTPRDPVVFFGVGIILTMVALAATYVPARRATRVNPVVALRYE